LPDLDEPRTLEMIANDIKAATDRGDFATVAQLAAEANAMRDQGAADSPAEPNEAASGADVSSVDESENCPDLVKKLPRVKRQVNPSVVSQQNLLNPRQSASAACRPGGGGKDRQQKKQSLEIPNTEAARLLQAHGLKDARTIIECSAAPLDVIKDAYARRLEVNGGPGLEVKVIREGRWKTCGKRVDNLLIMPALDDEDAWREHYIGGPLGHYVIGGPTDAHLIWTTPHRPSRNSTATTPSICSAMVGCRLQCVPTLRRRTSRHRTTIRNWRSTAIVFRCRRGCGKVVTNDPPSLLRRADRAGIARHGARGPHRTRHSTGVSPGVRAGWILAGVVLTTLVYRLGLLSTSDEPFEPYTRRIPVAQCSGLVADLRLQGRDCHAPCRNVWKLPEGARLHHDIAQRRGLSRSRDDPPLARIGGELAQQGVLTPATDNADGVQPTAGQLLQGDNHPSILQGETF
jgi:hypothetical protein